MNRKGLNVSMYPVKGSKEIFNEIKSEYQAKYGFINKAYDKALEEWLFQFDYLSHALVIGNYRTEYHLVQKGTRFGVFSSTISPFSDIHIPVVEYLQVVPIDLGNNRYEFIAMDENFKWGVIGKRFSFNFDDINLPTGGLYPVKLQGKWGLYYLEENTMVIEPQYEDASILSEGLWGVKKNGKWGFVDIFNNVAIPFEYAEVSDFSFGYAKVLKSSCSEDGDFVLLNHYGKEVFFQKKQLIDSDYRSNIRIMLKNGYYYAIGPDNDILIPPNKYRYLGKYSEGLLAASLDGRTYGYIDINEDVAISFQYKFFSRWSIDIRPHNFSFGFACVQLGSRYDRVIREILHVRDILHIDEDDEAILINYNEEQVFPYSFKSADRLAFRDGFFELNHNNLSFGDRFKQREYISLCDLIKCKQGKDISDLIRTDAEVVAIKKRRREEEEEDSYEWTMEDAWDAMTDGMYGDYPGGDVDYEVFGF